MESLTKRRLSPAELDGLAHRALGSGVTRSTELTDGFANAVWLLALDDGRDVVLKLSPPPELEQLSYERNLLRMEAAACALAAEAGVPVASVLHAGFDDPVLGGDYLVLSVLDGTPWNQITLGEAQNAALRHELGAHLARLNSVTGDTFGYPHAGITAATWREAYLAMVGALLSDTVRYPTVLPLPAHELLARLTAVSGALEEVKTPRLVHFDAWPGNVFLDLTGEPRIQAIIDHERAFWGDPLADLITPTLFGPLREEDPLLAGYRSVTPVELHGDALVRLDLYRAYLYLILLVENGPRQYPEEDYAPIRDLTAACLTEVLDRL